MKKLRNLKSAICESGHIQTSVLELNGTYEKLFCNECGEKVMTSCDHCNAYILGGHIEIESNSDFAFIEGEQTIGNSKTPNYCHNCGKPYPWIQKFLVEYKKILELQSEEMDKDIQEKIYKATEEVVKNRFENNTLTILKLTLNKASRNAKPFILDSLASIASQKVIDFLK